MYTLGINAAYHDSAAALVKDGDVVAAAEEERFTHVKHAQAAGAVLDLGAALPRDRLLPGGGRHRRWPTSTTSPTPTTRSCCSGHADGRRPRSRLPLEPSAHTRPATSGNRPGTRCSSLRSSTRRGSSLDGAPHHLQRALRAADRDGPFRWHFVDAPPLPRGQRLPRLAVRRAAVMTLDGRGERRTTSLRRIRRAASYRAARAGRTCRTRSACSTSR